MITFRQTKQGQWVAFGPVEEVVEGTVTITKKDGTTKTETVTRLGRPFAANGAQCVYGYLAPRQAARRTSRTSRFGQDHEDCLTFGSCGPNCEYAHIMGRR